MHSSTDPLASGTMDGVNRRQRTVAAWVLGAAFVLAACAPSRMTAADRACRLAPDSIVSGVLAEAVPPGKAQRSDSGGTAAGCVWDLGGDRGVVVWVDDVHGTSRYRSQADAARRSPGATPVAAPKVEGVSRVEGSNVAAWFLVDERVYVNVLAFDYGPTRRTADDAATRIGLEVSAALLAS